MIQNFTTVQAHGRSELTGLSFLQSNKMVSAGNDSWVKIWDLQNLQQQLCTKLPQSYLTAVCPFGKEILVGNGDGELMALDRGTLALKSVRKVHSDCINDIRIFQNKIVTASSDGSMAVLDCLSSQQASAVSVGSPVRQVERYNSSYFLAGWRSFEVTEVGQQLKARKAANISRFLSAFGQLYGTNDEKGFMGISKKFNTYVPCENMIEFSQGILGVSWSTLSLFTAYPDEERISYSSTRLPGVLEGDSILALVAAGKRVFAGSECGNIYSFSVNPNYHWYDDL